MFYVTINEPSEIVLEERTITNPSCGNANGAISLAISGGTAPYTQSCNNEALENLELQNLRSGVYEFAIIDYNGCKLQKSYALQEQGAPTVTLKNVNASKCNEPTGDCEIEISSESSYFVAWTDSPEMANKNIRTAMFPGTYTVIVSDANECQSVLSVVVPTIPLKQPEIALVTVGTESGKNLVVWQKEETNMIDHYNVWREGDESGVFDKLGEVKYNETSIFVDPDANIMEQSWRYQISATDVCGNETPRSKEHKTIHLQKNRGLDGEVNLVWDSYEGVEYASYYIFRQTKSSSKLDTLKKVSARLNRYTDMNPPADLKGYYVAIQLHDEIDVNKPLKAESGPFSLAISNIAELETSDVPVRTVAESDVEVYSLDHKIYVKNAEGAEATIYDINGQKITSAKDFYEYTFSIKLDGVYVVIVGNDIFKVVVK